MTTHHDDIDNLYKERMMDNALREYTGGSTPHGLADRIVRAAQSERASKNAGAPSAQRFEAPAPAASVTRRARIGLWIAAASVLAGLALMLWPNPDGRDTNATADGGSAKDNPTRPQDDPARMALGAGNTPDGDAVKSGQAPDGGEPVPAFIGSRDELAKLPANTREITFRDPQTAMDGAGFLASDNDLESVARCADLESLHVGNAKLITAKGLAHLTGLRKLKTLTLNLSFEVDDAALAEIGKFAALESLKLAGTAPVTPKGLLDMAMAPKLTALTLTNCGYLTDDGLSVIRSGASLETLVLFNCNRITDAGLKDFRDCTSGGTLRNLTVASTVGFVERGGTVEKYINQSKVTDEGFASLLDLPNLETLDVRGCMSITDEGLKALYRPLFAYKDRKPTLKLLMLTQGEKLTIEAVVKLSKEIPAGAVPRMAADGHVRLVTPAGAPIDLGDQEVVVPLERLAFAGVRSLAEIEALPADTLKVKLVGIGSAGQSSGHGDAEVAAIVARCPKLRALDLSGPSPTSGVPGGPRSRVTDAGLAHIAKLASLETLDLSRCERITSAGIEVLAAVHGGSPLRLLNLNGCPGIDDQALAHITAGMARLQELYLGGRMGGGSLTDTGLAYLALAIHQFKGLKCLNLSWQGYRDGEGGQITDAGLASLAVLHSLEYLGLRASLKAVTDAGLEKLAELENLRWLCLSGPSAITDAGLRKLEKLEALEELDISSTQFSGESLGGLAALPNLRTLNFSGAPKLRAAGLTAIASLRGLTALDLKGSGFSITPDGRYALDPSIDAAALDALEASLPKCRITKPDGTVIARDK